jgi:hypothetical protein
VRNAAARMDLRRSARFAAAFARDARHERPVFIVGAPRSGTTLVFRLLRESPTFGALPGEGHDLWRTFHHPRYTGWRSDAVGRGQVRPGERRYVDAWFAARFPERRFVEKTPENSLRIPYLLELYPDAAFVAVRRDPCRVIASLIAGWRHPAGRYRSYFVPQDLHIAGYEPRRQWCFALIDGWREHANGTIPEIAFEQWSQTTAALERDRALVSPDRWFDLHLEDVLGDGWPAVRPVCEGVHAADEPALRRTLEDLRRRPVNAMPGSPPAAEAAGDLAPLLERIAAVAPGRGYEVDPATGRSSILRVAAVAG